MPSAYADTVYRGVGTDGQVHYAQQRHVHDKRRQPCCRPCLRNARAAQGKAVLADKAD